jgi:hypothetical protein
MALLIELKKDLIFRLRELEATQEEIDHILRLHMLKLMSFVTMELKLDERVADELVRAYANEETWIVDKDFDYANVLADRVMDFFERNNYSPIKQFYLAQVRPTEVMLKLIAEAYAEVGLKISSCDCPDCRSRRMKKE